MNIKSLKNRIGLVQEMENDDIVQIGLNEEQNNLLQVFLSSISKDKALLRLPKEYNLKLIKED